MARKLTSSFSLRFAGFLVLMAPLAAATAQVVPPTLPPSPTSEAPVQAPVADDLPPLPTAGVTAPGATFGPPATPNATVGPPNSFQNPAVPGSASTFFNPTAPTSGLGGALSDTASFFPNVLGDQGTFLGTDLIAIRQLLPSNGFPLPPGLPNPDRPPVPGRPGMGGNAPTANRLAPAVFPRVRNFKVAENQSPRPVDRIYFNFNFFDGVNTAQFASLNVPLNNMKLYREVIGFEKTFLDGRASWQLRLPFNQLTAQGPFVDRGFGGNTGSIGDLAVILKYALYDDRTTGRLVSTGLLVNTPTGTSSFAGARYLRNVHVATIQPFVGYILPMGDFFLQGFSSIDVPVTDADVTMLYNDVALGYFLYRAKSADRLISAFVPTFEAHVNTPLNHRDYLNRADPVGTPDILNLTFGANFFLKERGLLSIGLVEPVTGPRPFNYEFFLQFNLRF